MKGGKIWEGGWRWGLGTILIGHVRVAVPPSTLPRSPPSLSHPPTHPNSTRVHTHTHTPLPPHHRLRARTHTINAHTARTCAPQLLPPAACRSRRSITAGSRRPPPSSSLRYCAASTPYSSSRPGACSAQHAKHVQEQVREREWVGGSRGGGIFGASVPTLNTTAFNPSRALPPAPCTSCQPAAHVHTPRGAQLLHAARTPRALRTRHTLCVLRTLTNASVAV